ncbi:MAG: AMP-binding protein [Actinomycetota bacterium]|nr:AMP-binding protein [Actinomycetota bacterium]
MTDRLCTSTAPGAVSDLLDARARATPHRVAFIEGATGMALTWTDLVDEVGRWRGAAERLDGGRVGLVIGDPLTMVASYLAALATGVTVAPLNPAITPHELADQDRMLGLSGLITDADPRSARAILPSTSVWTTGAEGLALVDAAAPSDSPKHHRPAPLAGGAALVLASSGTTGTPKIIPLSETNLLHTASALATDHGFNAADRGYCPLPLFHINALVVGALSAVVSGASLVVDRKFSARGFWTRVENFGVTWLNLVPAIIAVLSERPGPPARVAERVTFARSASAPLPLATRQRFEARCGVGVIETYGMTEAASQIAANPKEPDQRKVGSVGRAVGVDLRIVDRDRVPLPPDTVGQVEIRGANVVSCYWEPAGASPPYRSAVDEDGWLSTGDLGKLDDDDYLSLVGRSDDVINRGGEKLYPREIEEVLLGDPAVSAAAVVGRPHPTVGEEPVAFVIMAPGSGKDDVALAVALTQRCERNLSQFKRPASITVAEQLPSGPTGKIRHSELRRAVAATIDTA